MKKHLPIAVAALALAVTASAQVSANLNDLVLGFRATGGQGQNVNLEIDLGSVAQFQNQPAGTTLVVAGLSAADLATIYGSGWASRSDLYWGVVGTAGRFATGPNNAAVATVWATRPQDTAGTQSTPWTPGSRNAQTNAASNVETLLAGAPGSLNGATPTGNSSKSASINATVAGSYTYQDVTLQSGTSFGFFNPLIDAMVKPQSGVSYSVADLYQVSPGDAAATYLGTLGLSSDGRLTFSASASYFTGGSNPVTILSVPSSTSVAVGGSATFKVSATGTGALSYQWYKDGTAITGATSDTLVVSGASSANAGSYTVKVGSGGTTVTSTAFTLTVGSVPNQGRLSNLSINTAIDSNQSFTMSFVVGGAGTSGNKPLWMRAAGPSIAPWYPTTYLPDPTMDFYNSSTKIASNNDWAGDPVISTTGAAVGAFPFTGAATKDSAIYLSAVVPGDHSIIVSGGTGSGEVIGEVYDGTPNSQFNSTTPRLVNVSVNKNIGALTTVGFYVNGSTSLRVLIRAVGPGLTQFGVSGVIADPMMTLYNGSGVAVASNDDWDATATPTTQQTAVGAFPLTVGSKDAVLIQTLAPGSYTVQVKASTGATGTGIVEVYEMP